VARRLVRAPHVALPNVLTGERAVPELLQGDATEPGVAAVARALLEDDARGHAGALAARLRALLAPADPRPFGDRVAALLDGWLGPA
jgi:lipid-A-disaccharide synthase